MLALLFKERYGLRSDQEVVVVHHVLEDTGLRLLLQLERRCPVNGICFERVYL